MRFLLKLPLDLPALLIGGLSPAYRLIGCERKAGSHKKEPDEALAIPLTHFRTFVRTPKDL